MVKNTNKKQGFDGSFGGVEVRPSKLLKMKKPDEHKYYFNDYYKR